MCSPASRGIWFDLLTAMHINGREGKLSGTADELARLGRCSPSELVQAVADIKLHRAADVTERNGIVTLVNRRMFREHKARNGNNLRQQRFRNNGAVTPATPDTYKTIKPSTETDLKRLNDAKSESRPRPCWLNSNRSSLNRSKENELMGRLRSLLGDDEMARCGGHWRKDHVRKHPGLIERALNDIEDRIKEGLVYENRAAALEDLVKRWSI